MAEQGPIFLAGIDRSGIGLLGELLEAHPAFAVTRRLNLWSFYYNRYGDLSEPENLERCLADMLQYTRIRRLQIRPDQLRRDFQNGEPTYARLFALLQEQNMVRLGNSRWADKSLNSERYAGTILTAYPAAKMVHIMRDPRDRYVSQVTHRGRKKGKVGGGAALWLWSARLAERNTRDYPGRYKVVQYEALVAQPEKFLRDLCDFIDQDYSADMLLDGGAPRQIYSTSVGRYRETLSEREVAFMQLCTRRQMAKYGYDSEPLHLSWSSRVVYTFVDCPVNLTRLQLALSQSDIRDRVGRGPSARRLALAS